MTDRPFQEGDRVVIESRYHISREYTLKAPTKNGNFVIVGERGDRMQFRAGGGRAGGDRWSFDSLVLVGSSRHQDLLRKARVACLRNRARSLGDSEQDWKRLDDSALDRIENALEVIRAELTPPKPTEAAATETE